MSEDVLKQISQTAPNIPSEVAEMWLLPFVKRFGWPSDGSGNWQDRLYGQGIDFWNNAQWTKEQINLSAVELTRRAKAQMEGMRRVYFDDNPDPFFYAALKNDKKNFAGIAGFLYRHGVFPTPPIFMPSSYDPRQLELVDGSRRMTALLWAQRMYKLKQSDEYKSQNKIDLSQIAAPKDEQEVWICRPDWSKAQHTFRIEEYNDAI